VVVVNHICMYIAVRPDDFSLQTGDKFKL